MSNIPDGFIDISDHFVHRCGIYLLCDAKGEVLYVGQSINISKRLWEHFPFSRFTYFEEDLKMVGVTKVLCVEVPENELDATEVAFIRAMKPRGNCLPNGKLWTTTLRKPSEEDIDKAAAKFSLCITA